MSRLLVTLLCMLILVDTGVLSIRFRFRVPRIRTGPSGYYAKNKSAHTQGSPQLGVIIGVALGTVLLVALVGSAGCLGGAGHTRRSITMFRHGNNYRG